jgi:hypothetical protein
LGGHLVASVLKKLTKDAHLRARCLALVWSSGLLFSIASAFAFKNLQHFI